MMKSKWIKIIYGSTIFAVVLSGFAQMPIFKRYYIADIPGLGWLAQFYVTHLIHYTAASVLIALFAYLLLDWILNRAGRERLTFTGTLKTAMLLGLIASGGMMAFKNLPGVPFGPGMIIGLDIIHLALCIGLLLVSAYTAMRKKAWTG